MALLRFKFGEIYTCAASASFAFEDPLARGALFRGDVMINFSCDPAAGKRLARLALEDIKALQRDGPTVEEVATAVEVETRATTTKRCTTRVCAICWTATWTRCSRSRKRREGSSWPASPRR